MDEQDKSSLNKYILKILRPLARLLIKYEVSHSEFAELSRQAYAESAFKYFKLPKRKMTFARVAVLTGLSRKEVVRLIDSDKTYPPQPKISSNRMVRVLMGWITDKDFYHMEEGRMVPRILKLKEGEFSFQDLVVRYGGDVSVGAVLDELKHSELVKVSGDEVELLNTEYIPGKDQVNAFRILSDSSANLLNTGANNINADTDSELSFQRQFKSQFIDQDLAEEFKAFSRQKSQDLLLEFYAWLKDKTENPELVNPDSAHKNREEGEGKTKKVGVGIYYFEEELEPQESKKA